MPAPQERGFVCPEWAKGAWNPNECTIEKCTDGTFALVDHSLCGVTIAVEETREGLRKYIN